MPGIVGLISELPQGTCETLLSKMMRTIQHELFYNHGQYINKDLFAHVGWTCHKKSFADCMPVKNERNDIHLILTGEVYPSEKIRYMLRSRGHEFAEDDATYLVHLYEEYGNDFFVKMNGLFSGILIDKREGKVILFNDRFGMQRLFIYKGKEGVFFSSEAKGLLAVLPETREFDMKGLAEFLTCGSTLGNNSLFKDIEVLPGGTTLTFMRGRLQKSCKYFDKTIWENQQKLDEDEFRAFYMEMFPRIAKQYLSSKVPVAMSLTGGIDSRMILACVGIQPGSLPCYTFGSVMRDTYDVKVSRQVAKTCGLLHEVIVLGKEFLSCLPEYLERAVFLSDGYLGLSGAAELYANHIAREIAQVRLTGNFGSEVLRGVRAFKWNEPKGEILNPEFRDYINESRNTFMHLNRMNKVSFAVFLQAPCQGYGRMNIERSQLEPRTPYLDNDVIKHAYRTPDTINGVAFAEEVISCYRPDLILIPTDRGIWGSKGYLIRQGRRFYRQALFKAEYLISHGAPNSVARLNRLCRWLQLEELLLGRHKFYHLRSWIRDRLAEYSRDLLMHDGTADIGIYFNRKKIAAVLKDHFQERKNYTNEIDNLLTIALTRKQLLKEYN